MSGVSARERIEQLSPERRALLEAMRREKRAAAGPPPILSRPPGTAPLPASFAQQRLWFLDQLEPGLAAYNIAAALRLAGPLAPALLAASLGEVVARHEALRTTFAARGGQPQQSIAPPGPLALTVVDLADLPGPRREAHALALAEAEALRPFDLARGPLLRATLLRTERAAGGGEHLLLLTLHHIVADAWSVTVLMREMAELYGAFFAGLPPALPGLPIQYADFALWQRQTLAGQRLDALLAYWRRQLAGAPALLTLPPDRPRPARQGFRGAGRSFALSPGLLAGLEALGRGAGATLFMTLLAAFFALLARQTGEEDLVVGTPIANRTHREIEGLIGFFVNTLVLRADASVDPTLRELLARVRAATLEAYAHQDLPFEQLVQTLQPERNAAAALLFQVFFELDNVPTAPLSLPGLAVELLKTSGRTAKFDLALYCERQGAGLAAELKYATDLYDPTTIERLIAHFLTLLAGATAAPETPLSALPLLAAGERWQVTGEWNDTSAAPAAIDPGEGIHTRVLAQAARTPGAPAVLAASESLTYGALASAVGRLAARLRAAGVGPEERVAILAGRSPERVTAMLAVLAAGGAYVPLDPGQPAERLALLLADSRPGLLLAARPLAAALLPFSGPVLWLDEGAADDPAIPANPADIAALPLGPGQLAYITHTSGSTGRPKGVMSCHGGVVNYLSYLARTYDLGPGDTVLQLASFSFDAALRDTLGPLTLGARTALVDDAVAGEPEALLAAIDRFEVTALLSITPSLLAELARTAARQGVSRRRVRLILASGEVLRPAAVAAVRTAFGDGVLLVNQYGPTECTLTASFQPVQEVATGRGSVPVGRPIGNVVFRLLDRALGPVAAGAPGELYIGGAGLTRGYFEQPERTAERFVPDPLSSEPGARLYKTGDLARALADGRLDFLGRTDQQVKVHGVRVEPGEVEAVLAAHPALAEAAVVVRPTEADPHTPRLIAYVVPVADPAADPVALRRYLSDRLPGPMLPAAFVTLPALPRNPHGKVDRRALPAPAAGGRDGAAPYRAPSNPVEAALCRIWSAVLGVPAVGIDDDFFALGGHSLLATEVVSRVRAELRPGLALRALFDLPTVAGLAAAVERLPAGGESETEPLPALVPDPLHRHEPFPLTDIQQAYWLGRSGSFELGNVATHSYLELELPDLDLGRLERAVRRLVERHDMLRAVVRSDGQQQILAQVLPYRVAEIDLSGLDVGGVKRVDLGLAEIRRHLSHQILGLDRWPMFELQASRLGGGRFRLHISTDSLICDAWSRRILGRELLELYADPGRAMAPLALSFRDCVLAEIALREHAVYRAARDYWRGRLADLPPAPELPLVRDPGSVATPRFVRRGGRLAPGVWSALKGRAARAGLTPSGLLAAAYAEVLGTWSKSPRFTLNLTLFNRLQLHPEVNRVVGDFTSVILLAVDGGAGSFAARARRLQAQLWQDIDHRAWSGIQVLRELNRARGGTARAAMPVVLTSTLVADPRAEREPESPWRELYGISQTSQVFLDQGIAEHGGALAFRWDAVEELFAPGVLDAMFAAYTELLARLAEEEGCWEEEIPVRLPAAERAEREAANATAAPLPAGLLHTPFLSWAARAPERPAVISGLRRLSYGELAAASAALAAALVRQGVGPGSRVGVVMEKGWEQVVGVLAALRAGAAYLPVDAAQPERRRATLLTQAGVEVVLTQRRLLAELSWPSGISVLCVEEEPALGEREVPGEPFQVAADVAYVIFTSGSTGEPKGVVIEHRAALNTIVDVNRRFGVGAEDRALALSSLSFDLSVYDLFGLLGAGGTVVFPGPGAERDPGVWLALLEREQVTVWSSVPVLFEMLLEHAERRGVGLPGSLRLVLLSGDWLPLSLPERLRRVCPGAELVALGGATEASIWSNFHRVERVEEGWKSIPYGRPLANQRFAVLSPRLSPCPVWVPGQLYIGGAGLARGYLGDGAKTASSFVPEGERGERLYRTGDLGRYLPGGELEFLGREDAQVKILGHRIELGEIESALAAHPRVRQAVVAAVLAPGDPRDPSRSRRLVAYVVPAGEPAGAGGELTAELRTTLAERLPAWMLPSVFVLLDALPLSANGKVDRRRLPAPAVERAAGVADPWGDGQARTPPEEMVAAVWEEVLGRAPRSVEEDFYAAGGDSMLAIRLVSRVREAFGVDLPLGRFFERATVAGLAGRAQEARQGRELRRPPLVPRPADGAPPPLSFAQQRLWFLCQLEPESAFYTIPVGAWIDGRLDAAALATGLSEIVRRHEALRTVFPAVAGRPVAALLPADPLVLPVVDLAALPAAAAEREALARAMDRVRQPFDLARGPLLRVCLLRLSGAGGERHALVLAVHHIVFDAWSVDVLLGELAALYGAAVAGRPSPLPEPALQYSDFAAWQRQTLGAEEEREHLAYWRATLAGAPPEIELPSTRPRLPARSSRGGRRELRLAPPLVADLRALTRGAGATLFMTLLAAFMAELGRLTGQRDLVVSTSVAERGTPGTAGLIGLFLNTLLIRVDLSGRPSFRTLLGRVREATLGAYAHQDLPYDRLVRAIVPRRPGRELGNPPWSRVVFGLRHAPAPARALGALALTPLNLYRGRAKFDLELEVVVADSGAIAGETLTGFLEYNSEFLEEAVVLRLEQELESLLAEVVVHPDVPLDSLAKEHSKVDKTQRRESLRSSLSRAKPAPVKVGVQSLVRTSTFAPDQPLPLVVEPAVERLRPEVWFAENRGWIEEKLALHGGLLFRGFRLDTVADFDAVVETVATQRMEYRERSTPRSTVAGKIYTSTEYAADQHIPMHNESSYSHAWPRRIWFFCVRPSETGGETPIADSRMVHGLIPADVRKTFAEKQVMYVRNYGQGLDLSWQDAFQTDDRAAVESYCEKAGIDFTWKGGERLTTRQVRQAVAVHPESGEPIWFNQAHLFHVSSLPPSLRESLLKVVAEEDLPRNACFGDGSPIDPAMLEAVRAAYRQAAVRFPWQRGDLLLLDNMRVAHGRAPYTGARQVVVAMSEPYPPDAPQAAEQA